MIFVAGGIIERKAKFKGISVALTPEEQFEKLTKQGINCYAYEYDFVTTIAEFIESPGTKVAGRISMLCETDMTVELSDATDTVRVALENNRHNAKLLPLVTVGDIVGIEGSWSDDKKVFIGSKITMLTKSREETGKLTARDKQLKLKHVLYIDDRQQAKVLFTRSELIRQLRDYLHKEKFQEIDTPLLHPFQGDSTSRPMFVQPLAYENLSFALASSPELYLKKMLVAGFNKVFTVNKVFRDEIIDATHLMEFTSVEYYMVYVDYNYMMTFTEKMLKQLTYGITGKKQIPFNGVLLDFEKPWKKISIHNTLKKRFKQDLFALPYDKLLETAKSIDITYDKPTSPGNIIIDVFEKLYLDTLIQPTFIYDFPKDASVMCYDITMAKAKRDSDDTILERFELYMGGMELANCYSELNDPEEQRAAFDLFLKQRNKELSMDATFYHALRTGMPPASGVGFGIDRLLMILSDSSDILDTVPFSTYHESL